MSGTNPFNNQRPIEGVRNIIAVSSGKGGVGKSTIATHLALALGKKHRVGLLDADIYGPSIPRMMGALNQKPEVREDQKIVPIERYGIQMMSIGFLVEEDAAVVWRGPMLFKAMDQFLHDVAWNDLDYLVIDLPPGTGDIQLTLAQKVPIAGAVTVTTPQNMALMDVKKAIDMWERVEVPILGVIENMAYFLPPGQTEEIALFPQGELPSYLDHKKFDHLGRVPFNPSIGLACESGIPLIESYPDSRESDLFLKIAEKLTVQIEPNSLS